MNFYGIGREAVASATLLNAGINWGWQNEKTIILDKIIARVSMGFPNPQFATGFAEAFVNLWLVDPGVTPTFSPDAYVQFAGPPTVSMPQIFTSLTEINNGAMASYGEGAPVPGCLFTTILKANAPQSDSDRVVIDGMGILVEAASMFILHIDVQGAALADVEVGLQLGVK